MAVPFAEICTDRPLMWNVQLGFWRDAVEHFEAMLENADVYDEDDNEAIFGVDAAIVLVLAGTSVSILLGQQWSDNRLREEGDRDGRVPPPITLLNRLLNEVQASVRAGCPGDLASRFASANEMYEAIRHFGEPKHEIVGQLNPDILVRHLNVLQMVWNLVIEWRQVHDQYIPNDFQHQFAWPTSWNT